MKKIQKTREREYRGSLIKQLFFSWAKRKDCRGKDRNGRILKKVEGVEKTLEVMARKMARKARKDSKDLNFSPDDK